jgi:putrescine transport system permease protein
MAAIGTLLCLLLGYPMAYFIARQPASRRHLLLLAVILPFWISFLLRVYAWIGLLGNKGLINHSLMSIGLIDTPLPMLYNDFAVYLGIVYSYLPFMIMPLYANLERQNLELLDAAADLGAKRWQVFVDVTLPLSMPDIIGGCLLVFIPPWASSPSALFGGADTPDDQSRLVGQFFLNRDWPVASAVSVLLLLLLTAPILWFQRAEPRTGARDMRRRSVSLLTMPCSALPCCMCPSSRWSPIPSKTHAWSPCGADSHCAGIAACSPMKNCSRRRGSVSASGW